MCRLGTEQAMQQFATAISWSFVAPALVGQPMPEVPVAFPSEQIAPDAKSVPYSRESEAAALIDASPRGPEGTIRPGLQKRPSRLPDIS